VDLHDCCDLKNVRNTVKRRAKHRETPAKHRETPCEKKQKTPCENTVKHRTKNKKTKNKQTKNGCCAFLHNSHFSLL
jgi:hypothetical protein